MVRAGCKPVGEESPDSTGQEAAEKAGGGNLTDRATENRPPIRTPFGCGHGGKGEKVG